jgi:hypothetical protein
MKSVGLSILMIICFSTIGCSTLAQIVHPTYAEQLDSAWMQGVDTDHNVGSFPVYNAEPYALHLEIEETDTQEGLEQLNGDGGASLNAYAACLTLKVIF